jgi:hypothetical protein
LERSKLLRVILVPLFVGAMSSIAAPAIASTGTCTVGQAKAGGCPVHVHNGGVTIGVTRTSPGSPTHPAPKRGTSVPAPQPKNNDEECSYITDCVTVTPPKHHSGHHAITIHDLKTFKPTRGIDHMQPNGWAVIGLDTNFYSTVGSELKHGKLLGKTADVQFTPVGWQWTYGDGRTASRATAGSAWAALGIREFEPTPTSHVYTKKGSYVINLGITFSAQYRYGGGPWTDVIGTVTVPANRLKVTAGDASTVLVGRDCTQNPRGPGC